MPSDHHEANRQSWNEATRQHNTHKGDQAKFLREGGNTLFPEEIELLGDIRGERLAHLQCNTGVDTLSIASHLGADVTGIDISDEAIEFAQTLSHESGIKGDFIRADVVEWVNTYDENSFDVVFTSYGTTGWLNDLPAWGRGIERILKPNGIFVMIDFHPVIGMLDNGSQLVFDYMGGGHILSPGGVGDYVGGQGGESTNTGTHVVHQAEWKNPKACHEFAWGIADHLSALMQGGLTLKIFNEYSYSNGWMPLEGMVEREGRRMFPPEGSPILPFMFGIRAVKG